MHRARAYKRFIVLMCCSMAALTVGLAVPSAGIAAAEDYTTFVAHYEHRAQIEAQLQARAQSLPAVQSTKVMEMTQCVIEINNEIATLYTMDQSLSAGGTASTPAARIITTVRAATRDAKSALTTEIRTYTREAQQPNPQGGNRARRVSDELRAARTMAAAVSKTTEAVNRTLGRPAFRTSASLQVQVLQSTVEQLQAVAIELLNARLLLSDPAWANAQPIAVHGLVYATPTITIPVKGDPPVTDTVAAQPQVTDASGQPLPDMGSYHIQGQIGYAGVDVDALTGTITVQANATSGTYTVLYIQGKATERITLQIVSRN